MCATERKRWSFRESRHVAEIVPRDSAIFGNYKGDCLDGSVSHTEIVDFLLNAKKREKILGFYSELCRDLAKQGF